MPTTTTLTTSTFATNNIDNNNIDNNDNNNDNIDDNNNDNMDDNNNMAHILPHPPCDTIQGGHVTFVPPNIPTCQLNYCNHVKLHLFY